MRFHPDLKKRRMFGEVEVGRWLPDRRAVAGQRWVVLGWGKTEGAARKHAAERAPKYALVEETDGHRGA